MEKEIKFKDLGLSQELLLTIEKKGFEEPTPIQELMIPQILNTEKDLIGQAQTGTGKTAAFGLPILEKIDKKSHKTQALILAPTRELAIQVAEEINSFKTSRDISIMPIYGGQSIDSQLKKLKRGIQIVIGTPGRLIDHLRRGSLVLDQVQYLVLDEADEMLNMGFIEDIEWIMSKVSPERRVLLFSATMPPRIIKLSRSYMNNPEVLKVAAQQLTTDLTDQIYFEVKSSDKFEGLCRIIDFEPEFYALIFCRTKLKVDELSNKLIDRGYDAASIHGDISQHQRERILTQFKEKRLNILVATDVAARGLDIENLSHVINYSLPQNPESYIHRIGRTGRAGNQGTAITFITPSEYRLLKRIKQVSGAEIRKEHLPQINDIIAHKRELIVSKIVEIIESGEQSENLTFAHELLANYKPEQIISAMITHNYKDEFSPDKYVEIKEPRVSKKTPDGEGNTRLFIALGRIDNITPKLLVDKIKKATNLPANIIGDIEIYEKFSFTNVPFEYAEEIIKAFRKKGRDNKPLIVEAKGDKSRNSDSRSRDFRSNDSRGNDSRNSQSRRRGNQNNPKNSRSQSKKSRKNK